MAKRDEKGRFQKNPEAPEKEKPDEAGNDTGQRAPMENLDDIVAEMRTPKAAPKAKPKAKKRGPGRPKKKPEPEPEPDIELDIDIEIMADGIKTLFAMTADVRGPHWHIEDKQALTLARASDAVANKWLPMLGPWLPEITLIGAVVMTVGPRLYIDMKLAQAAKMNVPNAGNGDDDAATQ